MFNADVLDLFVAAEKADDVSELPLTDMLDTDSAMAMGRCVLGHALGDKCPYRLVNTIVQTSERAVALFLATDAHNSGEPEASAQDKREAYTEGAIAALIGLNGTIVLYAQLYRADLDSETDASRAVLMVAAYLRRHDHVERLLDLGLDVNTNLHKKCIWSPYLLETGVDFQVLVDCTGAMEISVRAGHVEVVRFLLEKNVTVNDEEAESPPLIRASASGHLAVVKLLLERVDIDHIVLELLTRDDIDVNVTDLDHEVKGVTALAIAGVLRREKIFNTLFNYPGVNRANATVLHIAIEGGSVNIVKRILHTVPDMLEIFRRTALCRAAEAVSEEVLRYLLSIDKEPINYRDERGGTALHHAVTSGVPGTVRALLDHPKMDDECFSLADLVTPLATAAWHGATNMVKTLLNRGDVLIQPLDNENRNHFRYAAMGSSEEVIDILSEVPGTEFWRMDSVNRTALQWAVRNSRKNVVRTLLRPEFNATDGSIRQALWDSETWLTEL
ncbi:ankyrin repeat-containing domain protein [Aspergillus insuetus]